jgi:toxin CcdB
MARFDVYANMGPHAQHTPYLLDVQSNWLQGLDTRMVIPLRRTSHFPAVKLPEQLCPVVTVAGEACLLETPKMAAVPLRILKAPMASLATEQSRVVAALDFLFQGY